MLTWIHNHEHTPKSTIWQNVPYQERSACISMWLCSTSWCQIAYARMNLSSWTSNLTTMQDWTNWTFFKRQNYDVGKNILLNRMHSLNNMIDKSWLNLSLDSFKVKCKNLFQNWPWSQTDKPMTNDNACALLTII